MNRRRLFLGIAAAAALLAGAGMFIARRGGPEPAGVPPPEPEPAPAAAAAAAPPQAQAIPAEPLGAGVDAFLAQSKAGGEPYAVQRGDTLYQIARRYGLTVDLLKRANGLQSDLIRIGQQLRIPKAAFSVIVDKSQNTLTLKNGEEVIKVYRCSTGEGGITPAGQFRVVSRLVDPAWRGVLPAGHPDNPLGSRWLGFDLPEYGIHGTNDPTTIGKPVTRGCVRLTNADVEELYTLLPEGTPVTVVE